MFSIINDLAKAAVGVVLTPVAIVADIVTLPSSAEDPQRGAFDHTEAVIDSVAKNLKNAVSPE